MPHDKNKMESNTYQKKTKLRIKMISLNEWDIQLNIEPNNIPTFQG